MMREESSHRTADTEEGAAHADSSSRDPDTDDTNSYERSTASNILKFLPLTSPESLKNCQRLQLRENDILICSYPKSGTTWTQHIVISLLLQERKNRGVKPDLSYNNVDQYFPNLEFHHNWQQEEEEAGEVSVKEANGPMLAESIRHDHERLGRRGMKTHLPWTMVPQQQVRSSTEATNNRLCGKSNSRQVKYIYVVRTPLSVAVSYYYHFINLKIGAYEGEFDEAFVTKWLSGCFPYGLWTDHVLSYAKAIAASLDGEDKDCCGSSSVFLLSYHDMISDLSGTVRQIRDFLDLTTVTDDQLDRLLVPTFQFDAMRGEPDKFQQRTSNLKTSFQFLRRGDQGGEDPLITERHRQLLRRHMEDCRMEEQLGALLKTANDKNVKSKHIIRDIEKILELSLNSVREQSE